MQKVLKNANKNLLSLNSIKPYFFYQHPVKILSVAHHWKKSVSVLKYWNIKFCGNVGINYVPAAMVPFWFQHQDIKSVMPDPVTPVENFWYLTYRKIQCFTHFGTRQKRTGFVAVEELKTLVISKSEHTLSTDLGRPSTQLHKMQKNFKKGKKKIKHFSYLNMCSCWWRRPGFVGMCTI